ncbi:hypothetical protein AVEN_258293-1 [Araneus ventricosus]|uniref:Uncharacterized protein n=1 Tax=Araneus ventricosus TaxID=182803 RepID=A0A4Y2PDP8_ARAVE|nr:hypothetical protein AVEN_258293-1 [Araneus ventricosus]
MFSRAKSRNKTIWLIPPVHHWYQDSRSGGYLSIDCSRRDQTTLTRFLCGHTRSLTFSDNSKCCEICPKCTAEQATPDHNIACLGLSHQDLVFSKGFICYADQTIYQEKLSWREASDNSI